MARQLKTIVKELRKAKGDTLQAFADNVGVTKQQIWAIEKGKTKGPNMGTLKGIMKYCNVDANHLFQCDEKQ